MRAQHKSPGALPASSKAFLCNPIYLVLCPLNKKNIKIFRADLGWVWDPYIASMTCTKMTGTESSLRMMNGRWLMQRATLFEKYYEANKVVLETTFLLRMTLIFEGVST